MVGEIYRLRSERGFYYFWKEEEEVLETGKFGATGFPGWTWSSKVYREHYGALAGWNPVIATIRSQRGRSFPGARAGRGNAAGPPPYGKETDRWWA